MPQIPGLPCPGEDSMNWLKINLIFYTQNELYISKQRVYTDEELEDGESYIELTVTYFKPKDSIE